MLCVRSTVYRLLTTVYSLPFKISDVNTLSYLKVNKVSPVSFIKNSPGLFKKESHMIKEELFRPVVRQFLLVEDIVAQVSESILSGKLQPGEKLVENRLAEQLGVSRGPVREAIHKLEQLGLVEKIPYQGTSVSRLDDREIIELHEMRKVLESMAVRLLAEKRDPVIVATLSEIIEKMQKVANEGDHSKLILVDADFHDSLIHLTNHTLLNDAWKPVSMKLRRFLMLNRRDIYKTLEDKIPPHQEVVEAIRLGDANLAEAAIRKHLSSVESIFLPINAELTKRAEE